MKRHMKSLSQRRPLPMLAQEFLPLTPKEKLVCFLTSGFEDDRPSCGGGGVTL